MAWYLVKHRDNFTFIFYPLDVFHEYSSLSHAVIYATKVGGGVVGFAAEEGSVLHLGGKRFTLIC
jgi:hypothetical protein